MNETPASNSSNPTQQNTDTFPGLIRDTTLSKEKQIIEFAVYRTKTLYLLGYFLTPLLIGLITITLLILITAYFMVKSDLSLLSILFALFFTLPVSMFLHFYAVKPSNKVLSPITKVIRENDTIYIHNVFPNVAKPRVHKFSLKSMEKLEVYSAGSIGYRIEIVTKDGKIPLGLFATEDEANQAITYFQTNMFSQSRRRKKDHANKNK